MNTWRALVTGAMLCGSVALAVEPPTKKELETASENLKQVGLAFHAHADEHDGRPADDIADKDGRLLLSWRVALLPYLGEEKLYKQFKLDEPWDGPNNKKLIEKMPKLYAPARGKAKAGETFYQRFVGKDTIWTEKGSLKWAQIGDGLSNTALVVEAANPVTWSQPTDLTFNEKLPLPGLGGSFDGDFHVLMGDGSVYLFKKGGDPGEMKKVIMPNDAQPVNTDKLIKK
ncbi:DUF1559 domain-containing protein [Gemmata sp. JC717]|uniref:DUF1559 domain-containing protein n=1 Tax=Gemmata algarum TaxID=2975278 RepID=A0ABU5F9V0_9BACT|nr:DUF1559 domain-containing protein [Gemmata algarum]MDY3554145.1 DUF1559 domain-containing protein [Gemmata algarum]MDY3563188.1 DUF1559 domain-containing protein [Gemmata algarum]